VQDYIAGRLSDTDRRAFEEQLVDDAGLVRELEESLRLREGLAVLHEQGVLEELRRPRRPGFRFAVAFGTAAAVLVGVLWLGHYFGKDSPPALAASLAVLRGTSGPPLKVVHVYVFAAMREAASTPDLPLPASGALELRALTALTGPGRTWRVTLDATRNGKSSRIGIAQHVAPDADGFVAIYADASQLHPGDYVLLVDPDGSDETSGERFAFRLIRVTQ
jgi:hypothetical protein